MPLKATVETLDAVPEAQREFYREISDDAGKRFVLDADGVEDVTGLKSALGKERKTNSDITKALRKLGLKPNAADIDAMTAKLGDGRTIEDILEELETRPTGEPDADAVNKAVIKATKKLAGELEAAQEQITSQAAFINRVVRENALLDILSGEDIDGNPKLLLPVLMPLTMAVEEDGPDGREFVAKVIDPKTKEIRMKGQKEMSLKDLALEYKALPEYAGAFAGTGASGSGVQPTRGKTTVSRESGTRTQGDAVAHKRAAPHYSL